MLSFFFFIILGYNNNVMKKIILILFSLIVFVSSHNASADVIMEGYKPVQFCAKITNLDQYPDIDVLADQYGAMLDHDVFVVKNNKCIQTYKLSFMDLYWNTKGNTNLDPQKKLVEKFKHYYGEVKDNSPIKAITREYILSKDEANNTYTLIFDREDVMYEKGSSIQRILWQKIISFFAHIFS